LLLVAGAVLTYAVERRVSGIDLDTVGVILMLAGAVGLLVSLIVTRGWTRYPPDDPGPPL
jgi:hypothetical protein